MPPTAWTGTAPPAKNTSVPWKPAARSSSPCWMNSITWVCAPTAKATSGRRGRVGLGNRIIFFHHKTTSFHSFSLIFCFHSSSLACQGKTKCPNWAKRGNDIRTNFKTIRWKQHLPISKTILGFLFFTSLNVLI